MLALTHHVIVQLSARRAGVCTFTQWFPDYALIGDDIVIANELVAQQYLLLMGELGVPISLPKSLTSTNGSFELAKRFVYRGEVTSPLTLSEFRMALMNVHALDILAKKAKLMNPKIGLAHVLRATGKGFRCMSSLTKPFIRFRNSRLLSTILSLVVPKACFSLGLSFLSTKASAVRREETSFPSRYSYGGFKKYLRALANLLYKTASPLSREDGDELYVRSIFGPWKVQPILSVMDQARHWRRVRIGEDRELLERAILSATNAYDVVTQLRLGLDKAYLVWETLVELLVVESIPGVDMTLTKGPPTVGKVPMKAVVELRNVLLLKSVRRLSRKINLSPKALYINEKEYAILRSLG
jgi:hypothetical protein